MVALVGHGKRRLSNSRDATEAKFPEKGTLIHFLQESGAQDIGDLKNSVKYALSQGIGVSRFISVHQRSSAAIIIVLSLDRKSRNSYWPLMNADKTKRPPASVDLRPLLDRKST